MGIYDREYIRRETVQSPWRPLEGLRGVSANTWLIIACVVIFAVDPFTPQRYVRLGAEPVRAPTYLYDEFPETAVVSGPAFEVEHGLYRPLLERPGGNTIGWIEVQTMHTLAALLHFSTALGFQRVEFWRFIGFQFLHANLAHLVFNMVALFFFGPLVERELGRKRYLAFYLLCGMFGAILYLLLNGGGAAARALLGRDVAIPGLLFSSPYQPLVGASAGVFGVLMAGAYIAPRATVWLFFVLPIQLRVLAYLLTGLAFLTVLFQGRNAGGEAGHLGGALAGFYFIRHPHHLHGYFDVLGRIDPTSHHYRGRRRRRAPPADREVDRILDKINRTGLQSLSAREKRLLRESTERGR
jgi:membrane associated rhomboid family serine protease